MFRSDIHVLTATRGFSYDSKDFPTDVFQQILLKVSQPRYTLHPLRIFWEAMATRRSYVNHLLWNLGASRKETIVSMFLCLTDCKPSLLTARLERKYSKDQLFVELVHQHAQLNWYPSAENTTMHTCPSYAWRIFCVKYLRQKYTTPAHLNASEPVLL